MRQDRIAGWGTRTLRTELCKARRARSTGKRSMVVAAALFGLAAGAAQAKFDIPTGAPPSPLFGAQPFTQRILMFEEFGPQPLPSSEPAPRSLPDPLGCTGPANPAAYTTQLDAFLDGPLFPAPTEEANTGSGNPWASTELSSATTGLPERNASAISARIRTDEDM